MPSQTVRSSSRREGGTASVELIAVIPFLLLAVLVAAQLALAGQALWSAGVAARAGARAAVVGREAKAAARQALPPSMRPGAKVRDDDAVSVRVSVPRLLPGLPQLTVEAETDLGSGDG
ncbi:MAG TPA: hypothetical protein VIE64_04495 [Solirubrobacterales bacterium]